MRQELKPPEEMTDAELDAELRGHGIDPEKLIQNTFQKVCVLVKEQSGKVAQLERTNAALLGALKRLATEMDYVHEAADMVRQGADVNLVRSSEGQEALKQARAAIAEAESLETQKENGNG